MSDSERNDTKEEDVEIEIEQKERKARGRSSKHRKFVRFMNSHIQPEYMYKATVNRVYDGDTVYCDIDLGFNIVLHNRTIRLFGINAPEIRGEEREDGKESGEFLRNMVLGKELQLYSIRDKSGKYGRTLGILVVDGVNVNRELVEYGYAEWADY